MNTGIYSQTTLEMLRIVYTDVANSY